MGYKEELEFVVKSSNDIFPEFLFTPLFNDFGDEYFKIGLSQDKRVIEAQKIRRKYRNYFEYINAMVTYNEYMNYLIDKYGSLSIIKNSIKVGMFEDFVPPKPKLKMDRKNKEFLKAKIVPSIKIEIPLINEEIIAMANELFPTKISESNIDEDAMFEKPEKKVNKAAKKALQRLSGQNRKANLYRTSGNNQGVDFIIEYMDQTSKGYYDDSGKRIEYSISDIIKEDKRLESIPEEIILDDLTGESSFVQNGRMVRKKDQQKIDIMTELYKLGIDILNNSKSMDKKAVKMVRMAAGDYDAFEDPAYMSKKELKAFKKRKKKEQQDLLKRQDNDRILSNTLLNNKFSFSSNGNNINFRLRDLYKDN